MENLKLSSPWILFYREIEALFKEDPAIKVEYNEDTQTIKLFVEGEEKADALTQLLPAERTFGNITVKVTVIPANLGNASTLQLFQKAFEGNAAFAFTYASDGIFSANYVVFKGKVVQYPSDDIGSLNGLTSALYQDIAKDIFGQDTPGLYFCTEPMGE